MTSVLEALINASERAAAVARACCGDCENEGALVVAEKSAGEANVRFDKDFKTIADVLAQESARAEIAAQCPDLAEHVRGEECAEIGGVQISIHSTIEKTASCLSELVPVEAARNMAEAAHCRPLVMLPETVELPPLDSGELGVWIDPIDATSEFILGARGEAGEGHGLSCVTVLVGAYQRSTGEPVVGVINQPFYNEGKGRILWGVSYGDTKETGGFELEVTPSQTLLLSSAESSDLKEKFEGAGWDVSSVPGAGHKLMKVALGEAKAYIVSKGTTFKWDTCAPHAILKAHGGDILTLNTRKPLTYNDPLNIETQHYCNADGIIAFSNPKILEDIVSIID